MDARRRRAVMRDSRRPTLAPIDNNNKIYNGAVWSGLHPSFETSAIRLSSRTLASPTRNENADPPGWIGAHSLSFYFPINSRAIRRKHFF
jgi:hypothetical protein